MVGGLLQFITKGKQDIYLTNNPKITFFKFIFKKHTNFSINLQKYYVNQTINYDKYITFTINNVDAIHRCYLEVEIPNIQFSLNKYITDPEYLIDIADSLNLLNNKLLVTNNIYENLEKFCNIELNLYRSLLNLLNINNIYVNQLKNTVVNHNLIYKNEKTPLINGIKNSIFENIHLTECVLKYDTNNISILSDNIIKIYNNMIYYLKYYNNLILYYNNKINELKDYKLNFNYSQFLGHVIFENFTIEINNTIVSSYSNDVLHIHQYHTLVSDKINNYNEMIGNIEELNKFNSNPKGGTNC